MVDNWIGSSVRVIRTRPHDLPPPERATAQSAARDLRACLLNGHPESVTLEEGQSFTFGCGFALALPPNLFGLVLNRSGLARSGLTCNPGVIDPDFRGEFGVTLVARRGTHVVKHGDRIAQVLLLPFAVSPFIEVSSEEWDALPKTARGVAGFGSTGVR
jgi:deoxyuridine 5'-triphosphate nucleotidohydrolase